MDGGKEISAFLLKPSSPIAQGSNPTQWCVSFPTPCPTQQPNTAAQCSSPMQQPAAQLSFSSNRFFSSKAKAEQNWFFCKLTQLGKKAKRLISISDGFGIKFHLISSPRQNVSVIFSPWQLYIKMKVNETRIKCPQEGEINLDFWQDLRGLSQNGVV